MEVSYYDFGKWGGPQNLILIFKAPTVGPGMQAPHVGLMPQSKFFGTTLLGDPYILGPRPLTLDLIIFQYTTKNPKP